MILYKSIDLQETNPIWEKFATSPLLDEIHIIRIGIANNLEKIQRHTGLLTGEELKKSERFVREQDKHSFLASSVMKKILCGYYLGCKPQSVEFELNEFNKPKIRNQEKIHFNTSHSGDWLVFAFSGNPCGIDVERINPDFDFHSILEMSFHPVEVDFIQKSKEPINQFFKIWTIKESILKAEGTGMMDNLNELNTLQDFAKLPSNTDTWYTKSLLIEGDYWCSLCFKNASAKIKFFEI
ncbi:4'-phosphopantetheinyl transferase family protein [Cognataquiflexum rubidum]|uniref:4'-phosphopantetheinyl transferase family protein n=1 Tax=Cognataquiflexum rubidum TaxID=2922273 RepID=UPI001F139545|nr:4'-phosphopantetheinyl transferase superfamily protein [Cognataquiflexum rubidum]MCH6234726.1 4'-phosphopantetheinyl transferase superfamily protein [Cognataquiflexum rubidum]